MFNSNQSLQQMVSKLNPAEMDQLFQVLLEYQKLVQNEARENQEFQAAARQEALGSKEQSLQQQNDLMHQAVEEASGSGQWNALGGIGGADIEAIAFHVLREASKAGHEDLKHYLDLVKKRSDAKRGFRRALLGLGAGGLLLLMAGMTLVGAQRPADADSGDAVPAGITDTPSPVPTMVDEVAGTCVIEFLNAPGTEDVPAAGPLAFAWARPKGAFSFQVRVIPPDGEGNPWVMTADEPRRTIYMENFPAGGAYRFEVSALDAHGGVLCEGELVFEKPAGAADPAGNRESDGGSEPLPCGLFCW